MAQTETRKLNKFLESIGLTKTEDNKAKKKRLIQDNLTWLINKTSQMFEYQNLPPTLPQIAIERLLQLNGSCAIWRVPLDKYRPRGYGPSFSMPKSEVVDSDLFAFKFGFAESPDPYDEPYNIIITNPGFEPGISETLSIGVDTAIIRNDSMYAGLYNLHYKYAELLAEAEISLRSTLVLLRDQMTFIIKNERQRAEVAAYIEARENGDYASILAPELGSALEAINHDGRSNAVELAVNGIQAIKSAWYNEIGLNPSFSLKREYTSAQEIDTNTDLLMPIIDDMTRQREIGVEMVNKMFGTNISVTRSSAWKIKETEIKLGIELEKSEVDATICRQEVGDKNELESNDGDNVGERDSVKVDV